MIEIHHQRWYRRELHTRLPFRYGIAVMERVPHVWLELEATIDGERVMGRAADHLPPKWFTKDPHRAIEAEIEEMMRVLRHASEAAAGARAATVHAVMRGVEEAQADWAAHAGLPSLLAHFGVSLVERALIDAYCRRHDTTLATALRANALGIELADLHPELGSMTPGEGLPAAPLDHVRCRHTVGLADPLTAEEASASTDRPDDGLPVDLGAVVRRYGIRDFKIKVAGGGEAGIERLERVVAVIEAETSADYAATLDGNESFADVASLQAFWTEAKARPTLANFWSRLMFLEQPLHRDVALGEAVAEALRGWTDRPALLIDESGGTPADFRRALAIGYSGVSHKNCKGVIHGVANRCLIAARSAASSERALMMSGEDLSNVGPLALPQDLAVQAALGNLSVERNGHHYFAGLSGWPESVQTQALARHPDLYAPVAGQTWPTLVVNEGRIAATSANRTAFGGPWEAGLSGAGECWAEEG